MNEILEKKYPYLSNFFETAIKEGRLFHSIILYGSNNYIQYAFALELARQLNCTPSPLEGEGRGGGIHTSQSNCQCQNCRWIRENKHPSVMTISKIDNKSDKSKTVISEEQTNMVIDTIYNPSDYHRVFIFCNADLKKLSDIEKEQYNEFKSTGFNTPQQEEEGKIWYPSGINTKCWSKEAANQMLKSIEEPVNNVTFIFLTNNTNDLLSTIVSRSQLFYVPDTRKNAYVTDFFKKYFVKYPLFPKDFALEFSQTLLDYQNTNNLQASYVLDCIQFYLTELLKANAANKTIVNKIFKDIKEIEKGKKMLNSYVKEQNVYEHLGFYFSNV